MDNRTRPRIVVVGGGFGGLAAIKELKGVDADITLIDKRNHHLFQPLLYQVATTSLAPAEIAWPIRQLVHKRQEVTTLLGKVVDVDTKANIVRLDNGTEVPFDFLVLGTGAQHAYFGHDDWEPYAPGLKTLEDATAMRRRLLIAFEKAEIETDPEKRKALLTFVIIGGGATGVELAGAIIELARITLREDFRNIQPEEARVVLIEAGPRVLANFKPEMSAYAEKALRELGVEVELNQAVTAVHAEGVEYGGKALDASTVIWAAGVLASPAARWLGVEADRAGRVKVAPDLSVPGLPHVFAIGDTVTVTNGNGKPVPGIGDAAKQGGRHAAKVIKARLDDEPAPPPFKYFDKGSMATIGYRAAVADAFGVKVTGVLAYLMWAFIHVAYLIGWGNRLGTLYTWARALVFTKNRGHRIITFEQAHSQVEHHAPPERPAIDQANPPATGTAPAGSLPPGDRPAEQVPAAGREAG